MLCQHYLLVGDFLLLKTIRWKECLRILKVNFLPEEIYNKCGRNVTSHLSV